MGLQTTTARIHSIFYEDREYSVGVKSYLLISATLIHNEEIIVKFHQQHIFYLKSIDIILISGWLLHQPISHDVSFEIIIGYDVHVQWRNNTIYKVKSDDAHMR